MVPQPDRRWRRLGKHAVTRHPVTLGRFSGSGQEYAYDGDESLITIARPGRGKSQALVVRNLLRLRGPAIVLDVKPELHRLTAGWRQRNIGPVVYFRPTDLRHSAKFNPLDMVPRNSVSASRIIKQLVRLLMVPDSSKDSFWESRAAQFIGAAMLDVALNNQDEKRTMASVSRWFSPSANELKARIARLGDSPVDALADKARELSQLPDNVRESLFTSAKRHIEIWSAPEVLGLTASTTWSFADLRSRNGTLYLCVSPEELIDYASLIRAILGRALQEFREGSGPQVTFFVDEFPQLGYMPELLRMLELGRGAGCRLWLFAQSLGQIERSYGRELASSILDNCAVRSFIEPTGDLARYIEKDLKPVPNIYTGKSQPLATAHQLAGPEFLGKVIVLEGGRDPALLSRVFAFDDDELRDRINLPV